MTSYKGSFNNPQFMPDGADNKQPPNSSPLLKRYKVDFTPDEPITHLAAGHDQVVVATKDKRILIIDTKSSEQSICDIGRYYGSRLSQIKIYRIFIDPTGKFTLISVAQAADNQPYENLLYHRQLQSLQKLKNHLISAVAWNYPKANPSTTATLSTSPSTGTNTTGTILLGTTKGLVLQTEFTHSDETRFFPLKTGPGHYVKEIFDVGPEAGSVTGIAYYQIYSANLCTERTYVILLATSNRLYRMVGNVSASVDPPPLHLIMSQTSSNYKEVPGRFTNSKLDLYYPQTPANSLPTRFAWLTEPGVMTSELHDQLTSCRLSFESNEDINIIPYSNPEEAYIPLSSSTPIGSGGIGSMSPQFNILTGSCYDKPISMVVTNFHLIVLMRHCIRAICILNNLTVYEEYFSTNYGEIQGMSKDPVRNLVWVYFKRAVFRYKMSMENKNVWKIFLEQKRFDLAKKYSLGDHENYDRVICEEAQHYFNLKEYDRSAELFASSKKPFEDVALMFMDAKCGRALKKYLMIKIEEFDSVTNQLTTTLSWLFEIIISSITTLATAEREHPESQLHASELDELYGELDQLLESRQVVDCIRQNSKSFYSIIQNYANWRIQIQVAKLIGDHEQLIRSFMNSRDYIEALNALKATRQAELFYAHGHLIMKHRPKEMVDALIEQPDIDPSRLVPILIQENPYYNKCCETIRYLEHCVRELRTDCKIIHNHLFELYAHYRDEETLIDFLEEEITPNSVQPACLLDLQACLRICTSLKLNRTCVVIYSHMGLFDEAVNLALEFDVSLAKNIARRAESEDHQKRLWLSIGKSVLTDKADIQVAAELLSESKLLKIEDVLVFFPDYKTVDSIESALHKSLQGKRNEIISIRDGTYEIIANEIRNEIKTFKVRYSKLKCGQKCEICERNIMSRSHYLFPCGHLFHYDCILKEMISIDPQYRSLEEKLRQLTSDTTSPSVTGTGQHQRFTSSFTKQQSLSLNSSSSQTKISQPPSAHMALAIDKNKIVEELYEITSEECVHCGSFLASYIDGSAPIDPMDRLSSDG